MIANLHPFPDVEIYNKRSSMQHHGLRLTKSVHCEKPIMTFLPRVRHYNKTTSGFDRCQSCGVTIPVYATMKCPNCLAIIYCSTMCMVRHEQQVHKYECDTFRQLLELEPQSCTAEALVIARMLNIAEYDEDCSSSLSFLKRRHLQFPLSANELSFLTTRFTSRKVKMACALFFTRSHLLLDRDMNPIGFFFEPVFAKMGHSCSPTTAVIPSTNESFLVISTKDLESGTDLTINYVFANEPREIRRLQLAQHFQVQCRCSSCDLSRIDPYMSFVCMWCKVPLLEIDLASVIQGMSEGKQSSFFRFAKAGRCIKCGHRIPQNTIIEAKRLYRELFSTYAKSMRIKGQKKSYPQNAANIITDFGVHSRILNISESTVALIRNVEEAKVIPPYCFPLNKLLRCIGNKYLANITETTDLATIEHAVYHLIYMIIHVDLALSVSHRTSTIVKALEKVEHHISFLYYAAKDRDEETLRVKAFKAKSFFKVQITALRSNGVSAASGIMQVINMFEEESNHLDDNVPRSAERILKNSRVHLKISNHGYFLTFADGQDVMIMKPFSECLEDLRLHSTLKHHSMQHIPHLYDARCNVSPFHYWKDPKDERNGLNMLLPSKRCRH